VPVASTTYSASLPLTTDYDVIVVGGGPSGCTAAAAAARDGAKTLLIEQSGVLGGSGTSALVPAWCPFSDREKIIYRGMAERILEECRAGMPHVEKSRLDWVPIDAERLKRVYDHLVLSSGSNLLFHTFLSAVERGDDGSVEKIIVSNKLGLSAFRASVFVDCTGDADLVAFAGADFWKGDDDGHTMPATHCFVLTNVDEFAFAHHYANGGNLSPANPHSPIYKVLESGRYPLIPDAHFCISHIGPGTVGVNAGHIWNVDSADPRSVSDALVLGRRMAEQYRDALAEYCPAAFGHSFLVTTAGTVGIRESRRIVGDYVLTLDDYLARRTFSDEICRNAYFIDIHHALDQVEEDNRERREGLRSAMRYGPGESHGIPYRCLLPSSLKNVLVAGRSISCERAVQGSIRVMPVCLAMGEAAGVAAAQAVATGNSDVHVVDIASIRSRLKEVGSYLP
jgi:hypothetical protein